MRKSRQCRLVLHRETLQTLSAGIDLLTYPDVVTQGTYCCATSGGLHANCNHLCINTNN